LVGLFIDPGGGDDTFFRNVGELLHGVICQKMALFIATGLRTTNPRFSNEILTLDPRLHGGRNWLTLLRRIQGLTYKGMVRSDMSKPALIFFSLQEYTQQNPLSKF
jgi:hypothetical protein